MKRVLCTATAGVVSLLLLAGIAYSDGKAIGQVVTVEGTAQVLRQGTSDWVSLSAGNPVFMLDTFETEEDSGLKIMLDDDTVLTMSAESKMKIDEHYYTPEKEKRSVLSVMGGSLRSTVGKLFGARSEHVVKTPTAVSGVKGTDYVTTYNQKTGMSHFRSLNDDVWVKSNDPNIPGEVVIGTGWKTSVGPGKPPEDPRQMDDDEFSSFSFDVAGGFGTPGNPFLGDAPPGEDAPKNNRERFTGWKEGDSPQTDVVDELPETEEPEPEEKEPKNPQFPYLGGC